jgi:hypothetical protein
MTFFESLLVLLLAAIALLQVARRLSLPYPAMLAGAGVIVALQRHQAPQEIRGNMEHPVHLG